MTDLITYETIRAVHRAEKAEQLQKIPTGFFPAVRQWTDYKKAKGDTNSLLEASSAKRLLEDLINRRQRKIVLSALRTVRGDVPPENLTEEEQLFFDDLVYKLKQFRNGLKEQISGLDSVVEEKVEEVRKSMEELSTPKPGPEPPESKDLKPNDNTISVKMLTDLPRFVGTDLKPYGPFKTGETTQLPKEVASLLLGRKAVDTI